MLIKDIILFGRVIAVNHTRTQTIKTIIVINVYHNSRSRIISRIVYFPKRIIEARYTSRALTITAARDYIPFYSKLSARYVYVYRCV